MDKLTVVIIAIQEAFNQAFEPRTRSGVTMCAQRIASELKGADPQFDDVAFLTQALRTTTHS